MFLLGLATAVGGFGLFQAGMATHDAQQARADVDELAGIVMAIQERQTAMAVRERSDFERRKRSGAATDRRLSGLEYDLRALRSGEAAAVRSRVVTSPPQRVDRIYKSMVGPFHNEVAPILDQPQSELIWLTGYRTRVLDAAGGEQLSDEYVCHVNLDLVEVGAHNDRFSGASPMLQDRIFTLTQGQLDISLPPGFGLPIMSDEKLYFATQVLNLNQPDADLEIRQQTEVSYLRDGELTQPIVPLFLRAIQVMKVKEGAGEAGAHFEFEGLGRDSEARGPGCSIGQSAPGSEISELEDTSGTRFTPHWVVQPGPEVSETNVTRYLNLKVDTRVHFMGAHMHPYAESLELIDLTDGRRIFKAEAKTTTHGVGLQHIDSLTSIEGIPLYKDHQYGLISTYNNPTDQPTDAMASMFLYMEDVHFQRPVGM